MKRICSILLFAMVVFTLSVEAKAKYVFYFIGDGMGSNQVNATEMYLAELDGYIGFKPLTFTTFPVMSVVNTYSKTNSITDSAAAGTALATGTKTFNGAIGVNDKKEVLNSVAYQAKKSAKSVGVITSVSIDHATPAAFYAHQPNRGMYYEIALDLLKAGFNFYGGAGFIKPETSFEGDHKESIYPQFKKAGYEVSYGMEDYKSKKRGTSTILVQEKGANQGALSYAIDRKGQELSLYEITKSAIDELSSNKKGFFLMVESGKIDWACHDNDAATVIHEVMDMDKSIKLAYDFYKKHPKETLIVVTADHETGGLVLGTGSSILNLKVLQHQKVSAGELSNLLRAFRKENNNNVSWEQMKRFLGEHMGFWTDITLNWEQEKKIRDEFEHSFVKNKQTFEKSMYTQTEPLAARAKEVMSDIANLSWASHSHSANYVPIYAIGAGSEEFMGRVNNTDIPRKIAKVAGYRK